jgi:hypothetical protein
LCYGQQVPPATSSASPKSTTSKAISSSPSTAVTTKQLPASIELSESSILHEANLSLITPLFAKLLASSDIDVLAHSCWGISHLCDGPRSAYFIKQLVDGKISHRLVELLHKKSMKVVKPALRAVGNIVCVEDEVGCHTNIRFSRYFGHNLSL